MRCEEIQERFVDLLYQEKGTPSASAELLSHLRDCPGCSRELAGLQALQEKLKAWKDEPPLHPIRVPKEKPISAVSLFPVWRMVRYAAVAALVVLAFLGISNADIRWDSQGFSFRTSLLSKASSPSDYYSREEMQEIIQRVTADSRGFTFQMMQQVREAQEQLWQTDLRYYMSKIRETRVKN